MAKDEPPVAPRPGAAPDAPDAPDALDALAAALRDHVGNPNPGGELSEALRMVSRQARAAGIPPEQMLVVLKRTFNEVTHATPDVGEDQRVNELRALVTLCIKAYYS
jgi:hypothetical protein